MVISQKHETGPAGNPAGPVRSSNQAILVIASLDRANDLVRLQALGAHIQALGGAFNQSTDALDVRVPPAVGPHMRVRDALAEARSLTADVTNGSHDVLLGSSFSKPA